MSDLNNNNKSVSIHHKKIEEFFPPRILVLFPHRDSNHGNKKDGLVRGRGKTFFKHKHRTLLYFTLIKGTLVLTF